MKNYLSWIVGAWLALACPAGAAEPLVTPAFTPLPPGQVEPAGWLRDWAVTMREGITGHLDERNPVFRDAWKGIPVRWTNANADGTGWPLEQCAYWLDGALRLGLVLHDDALIKQVRARIDPVVDGVNQAGPGATFIHWKKGYQPRGFDSWAHSQMGRALVALYQGTGEQRILDALVKVYADYPANMGGLGFDKVSGLCNLDAMMETYAVSGDKRILERATAAIQGPEVARTIQDWSAGKLKVGHLVITYENIRLPAVMYPWTGDVSLLQAAKGAFRWIEDNHMLPYGLASGEEYAAGVGSGRKTETCNLPAMLLSANWMYRIEGDGAWGDRMEKAFFNAGPAALARDGLTAVYYQTPNRIRLGELPVESPNPGKGGVAFGPLACDHVLCCIGACNRILPLYLANMWMATSDHGLAATLYGPCTVTTTLAGPGVRVKISSVTDYPFNESIRMTVDPETPVEFPLHVRVPGWCAGPVITVNGERAGVESAHGFARILRRWAKGDVVDVRLPMKVDVVRGLEGAYPRSQRGYFRQIPDKMFKRRALPYACVNYGPLLFALPIPDQDANTPAGNARWQFALDVNPRDAGGLQVERTPMPARWDWPLAAPVTLQVPVRAVDWKPTTAQALPGVPVSGDKSETVSLVPYGCTKFQISMFPVTPRAWEGEPLPANTADEPELLGNAKFYDDAAATKGEALGYINTPGSAVVWRALPPGNQLKIRYAAEKPAQLTLRINDDAPQKIPFPATGKWAGDGAYAEVVVPVKVPANAVVRLSFEPGDIPANIDSMQVTAAEVGEEVQGQYFAKKTYEPAPLPTFEKTKPLLPAPIYDANPGYVAMYWKAWELAFRNFHEPKPGSGFVSQYIDAAFNQCTFQWDSCFMTMFCNTAHPLVPGISSLDNFYARQYASGEICRELVRSTGLGYKNSLNANGEPFYSTWGYHVGAGGPKKAPITYRGRSAPARPSKVTLDGMNHPLFSWAEMEFYRTTGDKTRLALVWPPLVKYYEALQEYLRQGNGLYMTDWASMDNSPRTPHLAGGGCGADISCEMALFARDMAAMARELGKPEEAARFEREARDLDAAINRLMWDPEKQFYYDLAADDTRVPVKCISGFWALLGGVASQEQAAALAAELKNPKTFGRIHPVPTVAADQPGYDPKGGYWRGAVWPPTTTMVIRGLEKYGFMEQARDIALQDLDLTWQVFQKTGTVWENYAPDAIAPGKPAKPDLVGWSGLAPILYLLEYAVGLKPDAPRNELTWELRSDKRVGCDRYRFNGHVSDLVATPDSGKWDIRVHSDGEFTLKVTLGKAEKALVIKPGENVFSIQKQ